MSPRSKAMLAAGAVFLACTSYLAFRDARVVAERSVQVSAFMSKGDRFTLDDGRMLDARIADLAERVIKLETERDTD